MERKLALSGEIDNLELCLHSDFADGRELWSACLVSS